MDDTTRILRRMALLGATAAAALCATAASAQQAPNPASNTPPAADQPAANDQGDIIVTATSVARRALDTPLAVNTLDSKQLARTSGINQADILNTIPTIKADSGGGEVAANVFVRGLPSGGQYQFTPLEYDGLPVLSSFGLNSTAFDVYYRNDLGLDRLEFVRGGVSNLFGPGSVAGLINYISRTGGNDLRGTAQLEVAERGRYKGDLAVSGPIGHGFYYAVSGWYRYDKGPIETGLATKGFQIRGNLKYELPDDSGSVTLYGQYIDDKDQFYLPLPLDGTTRRRISGNDGNAVFQVITPAVSGISYSTPAGRFNTQITDGVTAKGGQVALAFDKKLGDSGLALNGRAKYTTEKTRFGLWSDGDGLVNVPETQAAFLSNAARRTAIPELNGIGTANARFTFADGSAVPANYLLFANRFTDRVRPMHDFTGELNLTAKADTGSIAHSLTLGGFYAYARASDFNNTTTYLAEFNNSPRIVNLTVTNPLTNVTTVISQGGLLNAGAGYVNNTYSVQRYAGYVADQMKIGSRFNFDIGARVEHLNGTIQRERTSTFVTNTTPANLSVADQDVIWGNGGYLTGRVSTTEWAVAAGALYKLSDRVSLYLNGSRGYFFPEIRGTSFQPLPAGTAANASASPLTSSYTGEIIKQVEGGIKVDQPWFNFTAAAFYTNLANRRQINFINDGLGGYTEQVNIISTRSYGVESTLDLKLLKNLHFNGNLTIQDARYTAFATGGASDPTRVGKKLERQPDLLYNAGLYYDDQTIDLSFFTNYTGQNYTANQNTILLQGWNVFNLDAGYTAHVFGGKGVRFGLNVFNLFDTQATTEGSPRQDNNQTVGGAYFVGRPVLPRRITGRVTFTF